MTAQRLVTTRPERVPLSFAQWRLWFLDGYEGPNATYNVRSAWRLRGQLDAEALKSALHDVVGRHESLRTIFPVADGQPYQHVVAEAAAVPDVTVAAAEPASLPSLLEQAARQTFDLARELPVRTWLFRLTSQEHVLLLMIHHIASDGWSMGIVLRDLAEAYRARIDGRAPDWAAPPMQYADYTLWQRAQLGSDQVPSGLLSSQVDYWTSALVGLPEQLELPYDRPRPAEPSHHGGVVRLDLDAGLHRELLALAREHRATLFMVLHAGLAAVLSRCGAGTDIPIGTVTAGRAGAPTRNVVGTFVNTLVLRADVAGDPSFAELLDRVRDTDMAAYAHQDVPFERLVKVLNPARSVSRHPLFQVMLAFQVTLASEDDTGISTWRMPGLHTQLEPLGPEPAKYDLFLNVRQGRAADGSPTGIRCAFEYPLDLFNASTVQALADLLMRLLRQAVQEPSRPVSQFEI